MRKAFGSLHEEDDITYVNGDPGKKQILLWHFDGGAQVNNIRKPDDLGEAGAGAILYATNKKGGLNDLYHFERTNYKNSS